MTGSSRAVIGIVDQVVSSGSNFATAFVASLVLVPDQFGTFVVAYALVTVFAAATRAFLSEPLIAHLPVIGSESRRRVLASSAVGASLVAGLVGSVLLMALGASFVETALVFVPWLPGAFLADAGRFVLLSRRDTARTLVVDVTWAAVQGTAMLTVALAGTWTPASVAATWGLGAWAAVVALVLLRVERPGRPGEWLRESRYLSGWFTAVSIVGQVQLYAVLLLAGAVLAAGEMAGLRAVQLMVLQPPTTFMGAVLVLATPLFARLALEADPAALRRARRAAVGAMAGLGLVVLLAIPLRDVLLSVFFPQYTGFSSLVAPVALQVAILGLGVPFAATLRGMRLGSTLCAVQGVTTVSMLVGAAVGLVAGGVDGLAWGMVVAAVLSVSVECVIGARARPRELVLA